MGYGEAEAPVAGLSKAGALNMRTDAVLPTCVILLCSPHKRETLRDS